MHRQAIIMADGQGKRWRECLPPARKFARLSLHKQARNLRRIYRNLRNRLDRLPSDKHLLVIDGETLLQRQVRQLQENGIDEILISSRNAAYEVPGATRFTPAGNVLEVDRFLSTRPVWRDHGEILFIYGDVFYSDDAMQRICTARPDSYLWFGRTRPGAFPGQRYPEIFAFTFSASICGQVTATLQAVRDLHLSGQLARCIGWDVYWHMRGLPPNCGLVDGSFVEINDITEDFDSRRDYRAWLRHYQDLHSTHLPRG